MALAIRSLALCLAERWMSRHPSPDHVGPIRPCYHSPMFNFGQPKTTGDWIVHIAGAIIALFLVWWMLRVYVL